MATTTAAAVQLQTQQTPLTTNQQASQQQIIQQTIQQTIQQQQQQQTTQSHQQQAAAVAAAIQLHPHKVVDDQQLSLNIRLLMQGKEVGSIIGKKGDNIKRFREESGAKINISDGSCPERIVTLTGSAHEVFKAFSLICRKFEEGLQQQNNNNNSNNNNNNNNSSNNNNNNIIISNNNNNNNSILVSNNSSVIATITTNTLSGANNELFTNIASSQSHTGIITSSNSNNSAAIINNNNIINNPTTLITNNNNSNSSNNGNINNNKPLVTLRLIIPASQCGSLIGRGGAKIKEIREITGATIQVASEMLPASTERAVTIAGNVESLTKCAYQICSIMVESPPKGYTIPYRPKSVMTHLFAAASAGQAAATAAAAYNIPGQYALQTHPDVNRVFVANNPLAAAFNPNLRAAATNAATGQAAAAAALTAAVTGQSLSTTEMIIPNGLIGCVIGKGGSKINEIRQLSGATIKISNSEEGTKNRNVTINGTPEAINLAQYLITASATVGPASLFLENGLKAATASKTARKFAPY